MSRFRTEAPDLGELSKAQTLDEWVGESPLVQRPRTRRRKRPWDGLDKAAPATITFNLRLNEYQRVLLHHAAKADGRSMQVVAKRLLIAALERETRSSKAEPEQSHDGAGVEPEQSRVRAAPEPEESTDDA